MKRAISLILAFALLCGVIPMTSAAGNEAVTAANALHALGLFNGVGNNADGTPNFDLDRAPSRNEAVTMLVRLLGKEQEAQAGKWQLPFSDVAEWAKPYVGYAYNNELTNGTSATTFSGNDLITASQYITFVLRALGYTSGTDFQWDKAWELSDKLGFTKGQYQTKAAFDRGDVAIISNNALSVAVKGTGKSLKDTLSGGAVAEKPTENNDIRSILVNSIWHGQTVDHLWEKEAFFTPDGVTYQVIEHQDEDDLYYWVHVGTYQLNGKSVNLHSDAVYYLEDLNTVSLAFQDNTVDTDYPIVINNSNSIIINRTQLEKRTTSPWFPKVIELVNNYRETLYALDGRTKEVPFSKIASEEAVGWYTWDHYVVQKADDLVKTKGYSAALEFLDEYMDYDGYLGVEGVEGDPWYEKYTQILQDWQKSIKCPVAILGYKMSYNSIGTPEVTVYFRNLTQKTINRLDLTWTCLDAYGRPTADYSMYNGNYDGYTNPGETLAPGEAASFTWTLYSNEETTSISNYYMTGVAFTDGTSWHK